MFGLELFLRFMLGCFVMFGVAVFVSYFVLTWMYNQKHPAHKFKIFCEDDYPWKDFL